MEPSGLISSLMLALVELYAATLSKVKLVWELNQEIGGTLSTSVLCY